MSKKKRQYKLYQILDQARQDARGDILQLAAIDAAEETLVQAGIDVKAVRSMQKHWHEDTQLIGALITQWHFVATPELKRQILRDHKRNAFFRAFMDVIEFAS